MLPPTCASIFPHIEGRYRILIFNPETDYALAGGRTRYNPPAKIKDMRRRKFLDMGILASPGDAILLLDDISGMPPEVSESIRALEERGVSIIELGEAAALIKERGEKGLEAVITPWGWNHSLLHTLLDTGIDRSLLKSEIDIENLRHLSHRRTTIGFNNILANLLPDIGIIPAEEFLSVEDTLDFISENGGAFLKAPWSSSGRGVILSHRMKGRKLEEWIGGCITRQGSVMAERIHAKTGDFATEWMIAGGKTDFLGLSMFCTSPEGRYLGNEKRSLHDISERLKQLSPQWSDRVIEAQRVALEQIIAPGYEGPVGIDMLTTEEGGLVPCVEINLRLTMGMMNMQPNSNTNG